MSVSTLIQKMITRAKAQKLEQAVNHWERYKQILKEASNGEQPDAGELDAILAELGKRYEDMAPDAELLVNREQWAADAAQIPSHEAAMNAAQAKLDAANAEFERIATEHGQKAKALYEQVRHHEQLLTTATAHRDRLAQTSADPAIKAREAELSKLGVELVPRMREIEHRLHQHDISIRYCQSGIAEIENKIKSYPESHTFLRQQRELLRAKQAELRGHQQQREVEQAQLDELTRQSQAIRSEQAELAKRKLIP